MLHLNARIRLLLSEAATRAVDAGALPEGAATAPELIGLERPKVAAHGDLSTNLCFDAARAARKNPRQVAEAFLAHVRDADREGLLDAVEVAGPGFVNLRLSMRAWHDALRGILEDGESYGRGDAGTGRKVLIEFVSANPTGPMHVGHGRGAVTGDALARLLRAAGFEVSTEYYVNNVGNQVAKLGESTWHWMRKLAPLPVAARNAETQAEILALPDGFPEDGYRGRYIAEAAALLLGDATLSRFVNAPSWGDDAWWDQHDLPSRGGRADCRSVTIAAWKANLARIREDLVLLDIDFDRWFSERTLHGLDAGSADDVHRLAQMLADADWAYLGTPAARADDDDAPAAIDEAAPKPLLFRGSREEIPASWRDEKDRVILRGGGRPTYFAADIAYHEDKLCRGFHNLINIFGADHHGYVPRLKGIVDVLGRMHAARGDLAPEDLARWNPANLEVLLVQMVTLLRNGQPVPMGKRSGEFVTLRDVLDEVSTAESTSGRDAVRFIFLTRKGDAMLDFDLEVARKTSLDNPVYYVQYGHARLASILRRAEEAGHARPDVAALPDLGPLVLPEERDLALLVASFPDVVARAARSREPHQIAFFLMDACKGFHGYYTRYKSSERVISDDAAKTRARLVLTSALKQVIGNALRILGVNAPEQMVTLAATEAESEEGGSDGAS